jgi:myo-inositol-1(or 4)-monophosphatase
MSSAMHLLSLAESAARAAAAFLRTVERPADPAAWTVKGQNDFVTEVDRRSERIIAEVLLAGTPEARIVGEELSPSLVTDRLAWIVDPLDGTTNYLHGYPAASVSIAAAVDGVLEAGVVLRLEPDCCFSASRGGGAWLDGRQLHVSTIREPAHALIGTGFPFKHPEALPRYQAQFARIMRATSGIRRAGSAALDLADVAAGRFDGFWELQLAPWDVAAGTLLVREAGGLVTNLEGRDLLIGHGPVVAGNPAIHPWLLAVLAADAPRPPEPAG